MISLLVSLIALQNEPVPHEFVYQAQAEHKRVNLAGTFNNWNKDAWPMRADADGRTWRFRAQLEPGKILYKFVLDGETWITDPKAAKNEDDGGGNVNSVLMLLPPGYETPARVGDGRLTSSTLKHEQEAPYLNYDRGHLEVQLRCRPRDAERVEVWVSGKPMKMTLLAEDDIYARYAAKIPWDRKRDLDYLFMLWDKKAGVNYGVHGANTTRNVLPFRLSAKEFKPFVPPAWIEKTVLYQIFPDRFENGDPANDPANVVPWNAKPTYSNIFGGDFAGVEKRLGHLKNLGIGAIYFNPIFQSPINHRYETTDYHQVDRYLGTNDEFARMTRTLKANGIRTVLDGVFNHAATDFGPFKDVREKGADSMYTSWFYIKSYPVVVKEDPPYEAWFGFPSMPKVNLGNPDAARFMLAVPEFWHRRAEIAGWRLDVANEVPMAYWREFRQTVKALRPDMWICGEVWSDGSPWLKGDQWDSVMNYPFRDAMLRFVAQDGISAGECLKRMQANYAGYVPQVSRNLMNLLSSHDTPRFLTLAGGDKKLQMLAATLQFGWPGCPSIYYGEELGMEGERDPDNRRGMNWELATPNNPMLLHYRRLVKARRENPVLQSGDPVGLKAEDAKKSFAFARVLGDQVAVVAANRSNQPVTLECDLRGKAPLSPTLRKHGFDNVLGGGRVSLSPRGSVLIRLAAKGSALLVPARPSKVSRKQLAVGGSQTRTSAPLGRNAPRLVRVRTNQKSVVRFHTANWSLPTANSHFHHSSLHRATAVGDPSETANCQLLTANSLSQFRSKQLAHKKPFSELLTANCLLPTFKQSINVEVKEAR